MPPLSPGVSSACSHVSWLVEFGTGRSVSWYTRVGTSFLTNPQLADAAAFLRREGAKPTEDDKQSVFLFNGAFQWKLEKQ